MEQNILKERQQLETKKQVMKYKLQIQNTKEAESKERFISDRYDDDGEEQDREFSDD